MSWTQTLNHLRSRTVATGPRAAGDARDHGRPPSRLDGLAAQSANGSRSTKPTLTTLATSEQAVVGQGFATEVDGHILILDVERDRYFLASKLAATPPEPGAPERSGGSSGRAGYIDLGLAATRATATLWASQSRRAGPAVASLFCLAAVSRHLERKSFADLVQFIRDFQPRAVKDSIPPEALVASFLASRPFFGKARICRLDAPALCLLMRRYGHPAQLMFGARLEPFGAHCWAELNGVVLNEAHDHVRQFSPVMAV